MTAVALYARYSSDQQSAASIEDQLRICREQALREKWRVVATYQDAAISGASLTLRVGVQSLLQDAQAGKFDVILAEALDRVSRDQADIATLYKHLQFAGVKLITLAEGEISELHVGLKGTMNALFLKDLAKKTHRGLRGRIEKGKAGGGLCYGYDVVKRIDSEGEPVRGERKINEAEALVVQRVFRAFAAGLSPRAIACELNRDAVPGPLGKQWSDTTLRGHVSRGTGILNNELYVGVLVWNRQRFIKNPVSGKRVARINPEAQWIRTEVPELRIVDDAMWRAVRKRQADVVAQFGATIRGVRAAREKKLNELRRPVFLLSGLLECGCCGGKYAIVVNDRYGCTAHFRKGTCANSRTIRRGDIERRALAGLTEQLISAEAVREAVASYAEQINVNNRERRAQIELDRRAIDKIERSIAGIMAAIEDGMYQPTMKARMDDLERAKAEILERLSIAPTDMPDIHPGIAEIYRRKVARFSEMIDAPDLRAETASDIRSLVGKIILTPGEHRGQTEAKLCGELMGILDFVSDGPRPPGRAAIPNGTAGPRNHVKHTTVPGGKLGAVVRYLEDLRQAPVDQEIEAATFRPWFCGDQLDQVSKRKPRFTGFQFLGAQHRRQLFDVTGVRFSDAGVHCDLGRRLRIFEPAVEPVPFRERGDEPAPHLGVNADTVSHHVRQPLDAAGDPSPGLFDERTLRRELDPLPLELPSVLIDEFAD